MIISSPNRSLAKMKISSSTSTTIPEYATALSDIILVIHWHRVGYWLQRADVKEAVTFSLEFWWWMKKG